MFSADYPFESMEEAAVWFDDVELNDRDKAKIAAGNAQRLFGFSPSGDPADRPSDRPAGQSAARSPQHIGR